MRNNYSPARHPMPLMFHGSTFRYDGFVSDKRDDTVRAMWCVELDGWPGRHLYQPAIEADDGWRDYLWQLQQMRFGENLR